MEQDWTATHSKYGTLMLRGLTAPELDGLVPVLTAMADLWYMHGMTPRAVRKVSALEYVIEADGAKHVHLEAPGA